MPTRSAAFSTWLLGSLWLGLHVQHVNRAYSPRGYCFLWLGSVSFPPARSGLAPSLRTQPKGTGDFLCCRCHGIRVAIDLSAAAERYTELLRSAQDQFLWGTSLWQV